RDILCVSLLDALPIFRMLPDARGWAVPGPAGGPDLGLPVGRAAHLAVLRGRQPGPGRRYGLRGYGLRWPGPAAGPPLLVDRGPRSEEHTSELKSRGNL